jgi:hypothetical protein
VTRCAYEWRHCILLPWKGAAREGVLWLMQNSIAPFLLLAFFSLPSAPLCADEYPRVYRTFMPDAGPSAFAVELPPQLALCYDPSRGGVNSVWRGGIDLEPTHQAKINAPAAVRGGVFYREIEASPWRLGTPEAVPERRLNGYRYEDGVVKFEFTLDGSKVVETLREDGGGLVREFDLSAVAQAALFRVEEQPEAVVEVTGATDAGGGWWRVEAGGAFSMRVSPRAVREGRP